MRQQAESGTVVLASTVGGYGNYDMALKLLKAIYEEELGDASADIKEREEGELIKRIDEHVRILDKTLESNQFYQEQRQEVA